MFENVGGTHSRPAQRLTGGAHGQRPTRPGQAKVGLDRGVGAATASRVARCVRACVAHGDGGRRGEAEPEWGRRGTYGVEGMAASLIGYLDGGERRRRGGAA